MLFVFFLVPTVSGDWVYQESPNSSNYSCCATSPLNVYDTDWSNYALGRTSIGAGVSTRWYLNYTIPTRTVRINYLYKHGKSPSSFILNISGDSSCMNNNSFDVKLFSYHKADGTDICYTSVSCWNGTDYTELYRYTKVANFCSFERRIYEEAVWWFIELPDPPACIDDLGSPAINFFITIAVMFIILASIFPSLVKNLRFMIVFGLIVVFGGLVIWLLQRLGSGIC